MAFVLNANSRIRVLASFARSRVFRSVIPDSLNFGCILRFNRPTIRFSPAARRVP